MTLKDYRNSRIEDLFLAVIVKRNIVGWEDAHHLHITIPDEQLSITAQEVLNIAVERAIIENNEELTEENKSIKKKEIMENVTTLFEECYPVPLLKMKNGKYMDLSVMAELAQEFEIRCLTNFKEYYNEGDFSFEEDEEGPYLNIEMEPFDNFFNEWKEKNLN